LALVGILLFVAALLFSVMVHEFGHYIFAKKFGMKVTEFFLGFGKRIWSTQRGETEFGIKAIPAGGYCRIEGMTTNDQMPEGEEGRAFVIASTPRKLLVLGAGSFNHFVLGFVMILIMLAGIGSQSMSSTIQEVVPCVSATTSCSASDPISPAIKAGLKAGDQVIAINGKATTSNNFAKDLAAIRNHSGQEFTFTVKRGTETIDLKVTPTDRTIQGYTYSFIGFVAKEATYRQPVFSAVKDSGSVTWYMIKESVKSLWRLPAMVPELVKETFGSAPRDPNGPVGIVGVARASGEITSSANLGAKSQLYMFLMMVASLNIFVGIFNLLPLLPLDGGHMAIAIADAVRYRIARIRGREKPAPIDINRLTPVTALVFTLLLALTVLLLIADIVNPVNLNL
jgi:membrane-associated protease RseP (regulator of RpoE activity)